MKQINQVISGLALLCWGAVIPAQAALFSNFEPPTYTAGTSFDGVDGWSGSASTRVTPLPGYPQVLEGTQSAWLANANARRAWNNEVKPFIVTNGTYISALVSVVDHYESTEMYFSDNLSISSTPAGLILGGDGTFRVFSPTVGGEASTGVAYNADDTYRIGMLLDMAANTFSAFQQNVTAGAPLSYLGTFSMYGGPKDTTFVANNGGLWLFERNGTTAAIWDDIQVIPEPSAAVLLAMGGLMWWRRR